MKAGSLVAMPDSRVAEVRELWRNPGRTSAWVNLETGKREVPMVERGKSGGPWGCMNCATFLAAIRARP